MTFDAFLHAQSLGARDAVRLLHPLKLRYFAPSELLRIFAFEPPFPSRHTSEDTTKNPEEQKKTEFIWPETVSTKSKYKLIGNSVNVHVVQMLIEYLFREPEP
jgi:tRNA (cytosine38-C5)-methyltransferase